MHTNLFRISRASPAVCYQVCTLNLHYPTPYAWSGGDKTSGHWTQSCSYHTMRRNNVRDIHLLEAQSAHLTSKQNYSARRNYYDVLEVTPKASKSQIKAAYYRLSKIYHPDMNKSDSAKAKFAEVSEAYEILGNTSSRRQYERGFVRRQSSAASSASQGYDAEYQEMVRNRQFGSKKPPPVGKTDIYNFDEFYRQHYGTYIQHSKAKKDARSTQSSTEHDKNVRDFVRRKKIFMTSTVAVTAAAFLVYITS